MAKEKTLDAAANKRMMFSYLGMLGAAAYFVEPKETYVSVQNAMYVCFGVYGVFYILFTFLNEMFFADNFKKGPKDNFGYIFMKMFGVQGFFQIFIFNQSIQSKKLSFINFYSPTFTCVIHPYEFFNFII